jgi:hypothetical protein
MSHNPIGLHGLLQGKLYFYLTSFAYSSFQHARSFLRTGFGHWKHSVKNERIFFFTDMYVLPTELHGEVNAPNGFA